MSTKCFKKSRRLALNLLQGSTDNSNIGTSIGVVIAVLAVFGLVGFFVFHRYRTKMSNYWQRGVYDVHSGGDNDDDNDGGGYDEVDDNGASDKNDDEGSAV